MSWESEVKELERRRHLAKQQGGKEGIAKQHSRGRLTIRERFDAVLDDGSFREHGQATASPVYNDAGDVVEYVPANYVVGFGKSDQAVSKFVGHANEPGGRLVHRLQHQHARHDGKPREVVFQIGLRQA